eukprot:3316693-Pleurochrysis_carterae.AAC.1
MSTSRRHGRSTWWPEWRRRRPAPRSRAAGAAEGGTAPAPTTPPAWPRAARKGARPAGRP